METTETAKPAKTPRDPNAPPKSFGVALVDKAGNQLRFKADQKKTGFLVYAEHVTVAADGKKDKSRGAVSRHETREAAEKEVNRGVAAAEQKGWTKRTAGGGFRSKPEAFTLANLPAAKAKSSK